MSATASNIMRHVIIAAWLCIAIQPSAADTVTLRYGQIPSTIRSVSTLYLSIAQQKGFLAREGIKLELVPIAGGTDKMVAALDRGAVDVTQTATPYLIRAVLSGSDATAIAGETANPVYSLIVKPQIRSYAELKGKTLGLSLPVDTISISIRKLLALKGLGEGDYSVKELVGTPVRFGGYRRLGVSTDAVAAFQFQVIAARRTWAQTNKDAVVRFVRGLAAAFRFIHDPANRGEVAMAIVELTGLSDQIARQTLALYFEPDRGVVPKQAEIDLKGLAQVIAFMGDGGTINPPLPQPERFVDLQYLRAAGAQ